MSGRRCVNPIEQARRESFFGLENWFRKSAGANAERYLSVEFTYDERETRKISPFRIRSRDPFYGGSVGEVACNGELHVYEVMWRDPERWEKVAGMCPVFQQEWKERKVLTHPSSRRFLDEEER